ncbi:hypothetical protein KDH_25340 [Dictyobacter sp. S3.2.2.5]|uniref:Anaphase-promoting complex subunit 4-like WD40 domain-containing protein n=1 Tax=Dictyobacter halimunensis TaxID=3026934 RepID=A0ABQ6FQV8_9CHLR|nr:hypothetical protein KDH_25340 [Dictyobacter sp. S3.2.2.5]
MSSYTKQHHSLYGTAKTYSRRAILRNGVLLGGALLSAGCVPDISARLNTAAPQKSATNLVCDIPWQGIDFAWLPDNKHIACASTQGLSVVDVQQQQQAWKQKSWPGYRYTDAYAVAWSSDGTHLLYVANSAILVQNALSGENQWTHTMIPSTTHSIAFSADGARVALTLPTTSGPDSLQVWDVSTRRLLSHYQTSSTKNTLVWSPDSTLLAINGQDGSVQVHHGSDGHLLWRYATKSTLLTLLSWSPDSSALAFSTPGVQGKGALEVWDAHSGRARFHMDALVSPNAPNNKDRSIAWSPDSQRLAFSLPGQHNATMVVYSSQTGRHLFSCQAVPGQPVYPTWSPDGSYLAAGNYLVGGGELVQGDNGNRSVIQFWDAHNGKTVFSYPAPKNPTQLSWSPNSQYLATITPRAYGILSNKTCLSMCRYGYNDYALQVFHVGDPSASPANTKG